MKHFGKVKRLVSLLIGAVCIAAFAPGAHAASVIISATAPTSNLLFSQPSSGGIAYVESEQGSGTFSDGLGQSFTPTGGGWELEAISVQSSSSKLWDAADKAMVLVIDNIAEWKTQSWGSYTDVLGYSTTQGGVTILAREEFSLATWLQPNLGTFEFTTPVALAPGTQYGFLLYLNTDNDYLGVLTTRTAGIDAVPGEELLYSSAGDNSGLSNYDMLFYLQGNTVPEPGRVFLALMGMAASLTRRRRSVAR